MKGIARILSLAIAILLISTVLVPADEYMMPVDKTVGPGFSSVTFDGISYRIFSPMDCHFTFTKIDDRYHGLTVTPIKPGPIPYYELSIQWGSFPSVPLGLDSSDGNDFELDTESGYAEKVG